LNLEIFQNSFDATEKGTLVELLDHCETAFGRRLLRFWIAHPLCCPKDIKTRLESVQAIHENSSITSFLASLLTKVPDLERILCRIHLKSCKLSDFVLCLESFQRIVRTLETESSEIKDSLDASSLLFQLLFEQFPLQIAASAINSIVSSFDLALAKSEGLIIPFDGAAPEFDAISQEITQIQSELDAYLQEQRIKFKCSSIKYKDLGKELFQLEIPAEYTKSITSNEYVAMSKTKAVYRYWTPTIKALVKRWQEAQEKKRSILANIFSLILDKFDAHHDGCWKICTSILAQIDCLYSFAKAATSLSRNSSMLCKPDIQEGAESGIAISNSTHPSVPNCIPNDVSIGWPSPIQEGSCSLAGQANQSPPMILLTGPNMGGKSTMLRQVCIQVILAQLGCYCPASSLSLVPFTKIFTRIGANDNILAGQSTFMVELTETCRILQEADHNSLVILDELGRGTSTFDGYAIAHATLHYLLLYKRTRGLFSTHYHHLSQQMAHYPALGRKFMDFQLVEANAGKEEVIFLYQLTDGTCTQSFGMNVARMAGIPASLIERAQNIASEFERLNILKGPSKGENAGLLPIPHQWDQRYLQGEAGAVTSEESRRLIMQAIQAVEAKRG
jgi:DNA mismatch repair protein MSH6